MFVIPERGKFPSKALVREYASLWEYCSCVQMGKSDNGIRIYSK